MKKSSLIGHTTEALQLVFSESNPADAVLASFFKNRRYLGSHDRRFISDTLFPMIRHFRCLEFYLDRTGPGLPNASSGRLAFHPLLFYVTYAVKILSQPLQEIIDDIAELWTKGLPDLNLGEFLSNLQRLDSPADSIPDVVQRVAVVYSLPDFVVSEWLERLGEADGERLCSSMNSPAPLTIRVNRLKGSVETSRQALASEGGQVDECRISPDGLVLEKRVNTNSLHSFQDGLVEMQDEGSQLISFLVSPVPGETVVDLCAGGGGKSLHMAALMENEGTIFGFDIDARRLNAAAERADAPCSGSGTFRRNPWVKLSLTTDQVARYCEIQQEVLEHGSALVRPGGRLAYATCSLLAKENEEIVSWFLARNPEFRLLDGPEILRMQGISVDVEPPFVILYPHRHSTDGFFAAAMERAA